MDFQNGGTVVSKEDQSVNYTIHEIFKVCCVVFIGRWDPGEVTRVYNAVFVCLLIRMNTNVMNYLGTASTGDFIRMLNTCTSFQRIY